MRAHRLVAARCFGETVVATPRPEHLRVGEVLLGVRATGICGSDFPRFAAAHPALLPDYVTHRFDSSLEGVQAAYDAAYERCHDRGKVTIDWAS